MNDGVNDEVNDADAVIAMAHGWFECATFADASAEQIRTLLDAFELRAVAAGREPLTDLELDALFDLQHVLTAKRAFIGGILTGAIKVVGRRADGEFVYGAP